MIVRGKQAQTATSGQWFCFRFLSFLTLTRKYVGFSTTSTPAGSALSRQIWRDLQGVRPDARAESGARLAKTIRFDHAGT